MLSYVVQCACVTWMRTLHLMQSNCARMQKFFHVGLILTIHIQLSIIFRDSPEFWGPIPKKYEVIRDAELSRIPNTVPNLSRFNVKICCSSSSWSKCSWSFWRFCLPEMRFVELKMHQIYFWLGLCLGPRWRSLWRSPNSLVGWGKRCPLLIPLLPA